MKPFTHTGVWWLPGRPDESLSGTLTFSPESGITMELFGTLNIGPDFVNPKIIVGTADAEDITLLDCIEIGFRATNPPAQRFRVRLAAMGAHIPDLDSRGFDRLSLKFSHLTEWSQMNGLGMEWNNPSFSRVVTYQRPPERMVNSSLGTIRLFLSLNTNVETRHSISLTQSATLGIKGNQPLKLEEWFGRLIFPLANFLTLATGYPNVPTEVLAWPSPIKIEGEQSLESSSNVLRVLIETTSPKDGEKWLFPQEMLFTLDDIEDDFEMLISRWLDFSKELDSVCDLYFAVQSHSQMFLQHKFLNLVQGLETFHRRRRRNKVRSSPEYEATIATALGAVPETEREWLEELFSSKNEPSLRDRLEDIMNEVGDALSRLVPDRERFIQLVRDTRNYLTHFSKNLRRRSSHGPSLYLLKEQVQCVLLTCMLIELGIPSGTVGGWVERNNQYRALHQWAKEHGLLQPPS